MRNNMPAFNPLPNPSSLELCSPTALHITHCADASIDRAKAIRMEKNNMRPLRGIWFGLHVAGADH